MSHCQATHVQLAVSVGSYALFALPFLPCPSCHALLALSLCLTLRLQTVPLFHFYLGEKLVEKFATREKRRILETIQKYIPGFQAEEPEGSDSDNAGVPQGGDTIG